jgi:mitogen-activated protein kinase kinase kinase
MLQHWPQGLLIGTMTSIKGANILVDNKGCIKLADFGASKKVVKLATISEAKSMKGTPYWMAPEVIRQTGHNWQASSVACTVIEMVTGKRPWSQQFREVAALFHMELQSHTLPSLSIFLIKARIFSSQVSPEGAHTEA